MTNTEENQTRAADWADRPALRFMVNALAVVLVLFLGFLILQRVRAGQSLLASPDPVESDGELAGIEVERAAVGGPVIDIANLNQLDPIATPFFLDEGVFRRLTLNTIIPSRPRSEVITYTVKTGDNLFKIAELYGLKPETILWGNFETLEDNPQMLSPEQVLNILPVDGTYYQWKEGDEIQAVADFFKVEPQAILDYSGNQIDLTETISGTYGIEPGTWLIVPGGKRELKDWGPPAISRSNPASAAYYGPGHCGSIYQGPIGVSTFVWPTTERFISGYNYSAIHRGIDIGGSIGNAVYATDSGVVVYAGWSNYGYGNLIVVDHGTGWQSAYAHMNTIAVTCGQGVGQGTFIGGLGSTGNSSGPHLHFELVYNGAKPNPLDFLP
jgi:murein DD-endopeptidase MepM/ murein hydrolase activator NlpD